MNVKQRWRTVKEQRVCFICLQKGHSSARCEAQNGRCTITGCKQLHHQLLHYGKVDKRSYNGVSPKKESVSDNQHRTADRELHIGVAKTNDGKVILQTAQAKLIRPNGSKALVMCLLDVGSQRSFVRKDLADNLGLNGPNEYISILTFGNRHGRQEVARSVEFCLTPVAQGKPRKWIKALCVPQICGPLDANPPFSKMWKHLPKYNLSDQFPRGTKEVDVLIGADYYYDFVGNEVRKNAADEPVGVQSIFGWILCGKTGRTMEEVSTTLTCQISEEESVNVLLRQFWQLDAIGIIPEENNGSSRAERYCLKRPIQFNGERYVVPLPWKFKPKLPNNYAYALQRLEQLERQMEKKPNERRMYIAAMQEYVDKGWVEEVHPSVEEGKVWYLPHHAVIRGTDSMKKCRVVFDGSASYQGLSLNDLLDPGPALQNDLVGILLRYRRLRFAVQADIEAMFLQIELQQEDRDFFRNMPVIGRWKEELPIVEQIKVPRWLGIMANSREQKIELHSFCHASELAQTEKEWPQEPRPDDTQEELKERETSIQVNLSREDELDRLSPQCISQLERLIRITAWCHRFSWNARKGQEDRKSGVLSVEELRAAERTWLRKVQQSAFSKEWESLKKTKSVSPNSRLHHLDPFIDEEELIRIGGRLHLSGLCTESRHQIVLPHEGQFVLLLIRRCHERQLHAGVEATLAILRQRFWILKGRSTVKRVVRNCAVCRRVCSRPFEQKMAPLPEGRVTIAYPFERTGVDFAGPLYIRRGRRVAKVYVCVFTCMVTRAIHLEPVSTMTTEDFIMALRRFMSRRGKPACIQSDNFRSFKAADEEIKRLFASVSFDRVQDNLSKDRI
ncbi:DUF1758 and Peptidase A17 domain containing prote in, partial [Trichuris trichiura]